LTIDNLKGNSQRET